MLRPNTYSRPVRPVLSDAEWDILHAERMAERRRLNGGHQ